MSLHRTTACIRRFYFGDPRRELYARQIRQARRQRDNATDLLDSCYYRWVAKAKLEASRIYCKPSRIPRIPHENK